MSRRLAERVTRDLAQIADRAHPAPDAWARIERRIRSDTAHLQEEAIVVTLEEPTRTHKRPNARLGLVAAAVVVVAGAVVLFAVRRDDDGALVPSPAAPSETGEAFVAARNSWDAARTRELLADDATISDFSGSDPAALGDEVAFERATGVQFDDATCTAATTARPAEVTCTYQLRNAWSEALGTGPFAGEFRLTVDGDVITSVTNDFPYADNGFAPGAWDPFFDWISGAHPDDVATLYTDGGEVQRITPDAVALWATRTAEFVATPRTAVQAGEAFVGALDAWDAAGVRAVLADDASVDRLFGGDLTELDAHIGFSRAVGVHYDDVSCVADAPGAPVELTCAYRLRNSWSDALGVGPFDGHFVLRVEGDRITTAIDDFPVERNGFSTAVWEPFLAWVQATHPDDVDVLYDDDGSLERVTPEALALWATRTEEFVASQPSG